MLAVQRSRLLALAVAVTLIGGVAVAGVASAAPNPPGNNGTVKIDEEPFDDAPDNEPHVGCTFEVDLYGYDQGDDLNADVTFESHPPTGPVQVLLTDTVFIGEDDNAGGGSEAGLDASSAYTLDFTGIEPHPNQGFHVKLTINADGSQGADVKHKVFWVTGCGGVSPTTTTIGTSGTTTTTTLGDTNGSGRSTTTTSVGGSVGGGSSTSTGGGGLPFTGASAMPLLVVGLALLGLGAAGLLVRSQQRRT